MRYHRQSFMCACAATILLVGCTSARTRIPEALVAEQFGRGDSAANRAAVAVRVEPGDPVADPRQATWWLAFEDPGLNDLVGEVLGVNQDLAAAGFRLQRAWISAGLVGDESWPQVSASLSARQSRRIDTRDQWARGTGATLGIDYEVDLWGRLRAQKDSAAWAAAATAGDLDATRLSVIGTTCSLYWTLGYLNRRVLLGAASIDRLERTLSLVRTQADAGAVSRLELREVEQNLRTAELQQSELVQQRVEARNSLTALLDGKTWPEARELSNLDELRAPAPREGVPAELLARRPDLRASVDRLRVAIADERATSRTFFPQISLTGSLGTASNALKDILASPVATLGAGITLPFLQWNKVRLNRAASRVDTQLAVVEFRQNLYQAFVEVDNALSGRSQLQLQLASAEGALAAAEEVESLYEVRYRSGATALRTWLDAQETRRNAQLALEQVRLNVLENSAQLFLALGGA